MFSNVSSQNMCVVYEGVLEREREYDSPGVLISDKKIQKPTNVYWSARLHIKHVVYLKSVDKSYPTSATYISFIHCLVKVKQNHVSR